MTKTKPNASCPCGSTKKYKKCCKAKDLTTALKVAGSAPLAAVDLVTAAALVGNEKQKQKGTASGKAVRSGGGGSGARVRSHTSGGNSSR